MADDGILGPLDDLTDRVPEAFAVGDPERVARVLGGFPALMTAIEQGLTENADELGSQGMAELSQHLYEIAGHLHTAAEMGGEAIIANLVGWVLSR